jgi:hypothetical protein
MKVHGLAELERALLALPKELTGFNGGPVVFALRAAGKPILEDAKAAAPASESGSYYYTTKKGGERRLGKPGRLRDAIKMQRHPNPKYLNEIVGVGVDLGRTRSDESGAFYAFVVEFRTRFLRNAFEKNKSSSVNLFKSKLAASIVRIGKKIGDTNAQAMAKYK